MKINWLKIRSNTIIDLLYSIIIYLNILKFYDLLVYLKQGFWCKDCYKAYTICNCNYCEDCRGRYCVCNVEGLRNWTKFFILYNLSKDIYIEIIETISDFKDNTPVSDYLKSLIKKYENKLV